MRLIQFSRDNPSTNQKFVSLHWEFHKKTPQAANTSVKPQISMLQMTHETILSCVRLQNNVSMARKMQPWQNTAYIYIFEAIL